MITTHIYLILLIAIAIYALNKKINIMGIILLGLYIFIGIFSVYAVGEKMLKTENLTLFPYLFLIMAYLVYFSPFLTKSESLGLKKITCNINGKYKFFALIYIVCALISIKCYIPYLGNLFREGNWSETRYALYQGTIEFPYSNMIEYLAMQIAGYTRLLALIVGFLFLQAGQNKKNYFRGFTLIITSTLSMLCSAFYTSSRGSIVNAFVLIIALYCFFYSGIKKNRRRFFTIIAILGICGVVPYFVAVTISRFSPINASNSIIQYLGQPPVIFNYGVFTVTSHSFGNYGFGELFGTSFSEAEVGGTWNTGFFTFVGALYIDWGMIGTLIIGVLVSAVIGLCIKKKQYDTSDVFFIMSYYQFLLQGVFVIGRGYCYTLLANIFIYIFLKVFVEHKKYKIGRITF